MIQQYLNNLNLRFIVLASSSPRRKEILQNIGLTVHTIPSTFEENLDINEYSSVSEYVIETAKLKALNVCDYLKKKKKEADLVIGADTVVVLDKEVLGKPKTKENALKMLNRLSGKTHKVITGVTLVHFNPFQGEDKLCCSTFHEQTDVTFGSLSEESIKAYVETGEPLDKAGAYGIQGIGATLIEAINGDYFNVVGFPVHKFAIEIKKLCEQHLL